MTDIARTSPVRALRWASPARDPVPFITCPYCRVTFGPWGSQIIEACQLCQRPIHRSIGWRSPQRAVLLLDTINAIQGIGIMLAGIVFLLGAATLRGLCACVALAVFVSASAYIGDGVLSWRTRISKVYGTIVTGSRARAAGAAGIIFGCAALLLSLSGLAYLMTQPA